MLSTEMSSIDNQTAPRPLRSGLTSRLPDVSDVAWSSFVKVLRTNKISGVGASGGLGMFEIRPRRLHDLGLASDLRQERMPSRRLIWTCRLNSSEKNFLRDPNRQYEVFCQSISDYFDKLKSGAIKKPDDMSISGALAVLHRAGPNALSGKLFSDTTALYERAKDLF